MATENWIASAARTERRPVGTGDMGTLGQHVLNLARADEDREELDRRRARRHVVRLTGGHECQLVCLASVHDGSHEAKPCVFDCCHPDHARDELAAADLLAALGLEAM